MKIRIRMTMSILAGLALLCSLPASAASFDCAAARSQVERLVCATPELSAMDEDLGYLYRHLAVSAGAAQERMTQRLWVKQRDACAADVACVRSAYVHRISALLNSPALKLPEKGGNELAATKVRLKSGWIIDDREGPAPSRPCPELRDYLNEKAGYWWRPDSNRYYTYCATAVQQSPLFTTPPWRKLAPAFHRGLIAKLLRLRDERSFAYFGGLHRRDEAYYLKQTEEFIANGSSLELWSGHFFDSVTDAMTAQSMNTAGQVQHLAQIGLTVPDAADLPYRSPACDSPKKRFSQYLVSENLAGPAAVVADGLEDGVLTLYRGRPVLLSSDGAQQELTFPLDDGAETKCRLRFIKD